MPTAQTNSIQLYYEMHGTGQPLVFIHGLGSSTRDWEAQVPEFSKSFQVLTFDLRGHASPTSRPGHTTWLRLELTCSRCSKAWALGRPMLSDCRSVVVSPCSSPLIILRT